MTAATQEDAPALRWVMGSNLLIPIELREAARVMERTLSQNEYHNAHLL